MHTHEHIEDDSQPHDVVDHRCMCFDHASNITTSSTLLCVVMQDSLQDLAISGPLEIFLVQGKKISTPIVHPLAYKPKFKFQNLILGQIFGLTVVYFTTFVFKQLRMYIYISFIYKLFLFVGKPLQLIINNVVTTKISWNY